MRKNHLAQQLIWCFMQENPTFSTKQITDCCNQKNYDVSLRTVWHYIKCLKDAGYIELAIAKKPPLPPVYQLTKQWGIHAPLISETGKISNPYQEGLDDFNKMWAAMRILKAFSPQQISMCAEANLNAVNKYVSCLRQAGFIRCVQKQWHGQSKYQLIRDSGPIAPRYSWKIGKVIDFNTKLLYEVQKEVVCAG